jgi:hypothetical protein
MAKMSLSLQVLHFMRFLRIYLKGVSRIKKFHNLAAINRILTNPDRGA